MAAKAAIETTSSAMPAASQVQRTRASTLSDPATSEFSAAAAAVKRPTATIATAAGTTARDHPGLPGRLAKLSITGAVPPGQPPLKGRTSGADNYRFLSIPERSSAQAHRLAPRGPPRPETRLGGTTCGYNEPVGTRTRVATVQRYLQDGLAWLLPGLGSASRPSYRPVSWPRTPSTGTDSRVQRPGCTTTPSTRTRPYLTSRPRREPWHASSTAASPAARPTATRTRDLLFMTCWPAPSAV